jgi:hypothetical protein
MKRSDPAEVAVGIGIRPADPWRARPSGVASLMSGCNGHVVSPSFSSPGTAVA